MQGLRLNFFRAFKKLVMTLRYLTIVEVSSVIVLLNRFKSDRGGVAAIYFAVILIPMFTAVGAGVDISRAYSVKERLAQAIDAAALAVGTSTSTDSAVLTQIMLSYFNANYPTEEIGVPAIPTLTVSGNSIIITGTADVDTTLLKIVGLDTLQVSADNEVVKDTTGVEVALVLDNTGSMQGSKLELLIQSANQFVDILYGDEEVIEGVKIAVIPFADSVNIGTNNESITVAPSFIVPNNSFALGGVLVENLPRRFIRSTGVFLSSENNTWSGCVDARRGTTAGQTNDTNDEPTASERWARKYTQGTVFTVGGTSFYGFSSFNNGSSFLFSCPEPLLPLTAEKSTIKSKISSMVADGVTHINLGAVWGWRTLSPTEPFSEGKAFDDDTNRKVLVIMTDGANLTQPSSFFSSSFGGAFYTAYGVLDQEVLGSTQAQAITALDERLSQTCENIKATGITVYTITFDLDDPDTLALMTDCATDPTKSFAAEGADLQSTFELIGAEVSRLRLSR